MLLMSAHGHYSTEKAAQMLSFGNAAVKSVAVDDEGRMVPSILEIQIEKAKADGYTPFMSVPQPKPQF